MKFCFCVADSSHLCSEIFQQPILCETFSAGAVYVDSSRRENRVVVGNLVIESYPIQRHRRVQDY